MQTVQTVIPLAQLDRFWGRELGCEPADLRTGELRLVPCGQRQLQVLATPDGIVVIGLPPLLERVSGSATGDLLEPRFWAERFAVRPERLAFYGPGSLSYVTARSFQPVAHPFVRPLRRRDAGDLPRFARILHAREPEIFHSWAIGGRVTANESLWGAYLEGKIVSVASLRPVHKTLYEVGINTLPPHRRKGWGTAVASTATAGGLTLAPLVQWSAPLHNEPSMRIAQRLGFQPYAHFLWLSLPDDIIEGLAK
jgi:RimJ/RimL family protein N-acetyltransferase